jgi:hypothetical protein
MNLQWTRKKQSKSPRVEQIFHSFQIRFFLQLAFLLVRSLSLRERVISQCKTHLVTGRVV